jgi:hypothetical protein
MTDDLQRTVNADVERIETATNQDINLARWRIRQIATMQRAQRDIKAATLLLIGVPVIVVLIILVIFYSGHS